MFMTNSELLRLKETELSILEVFDNYCQKHGLRYYLIGGALLGSVRYGGFIPWDDDIDVAMPREDYETLKKIWQAESIDGYFLQSSETDINFARCIMKLRKDGTEIIEKASAEVEMHNGIYIDIFPIDYVDELSDKVAKRASAIRRLMSLRAIKSGYRGNHQCIKKIIKYCIFWLSEEVIENRIYRLCTAENQGLRKYAILYLHNYPWQKQIHPIEVFGDGKGCLFEGEKFTAPADTHKFLTKVFGEDYMQEPPDNKKRNPHNYVSIKFQ